MEVAKVLSCFQAQGPRMLNYLQRLEKGEIQPPLHSLRSHQIEAVLKLVKYFDPQDKSVNPDGDTIALVVLPTGCGKTGVAVLASYVLSSVQSQACVLVITPSMIISEQIDGAYRHFLVKCGIISEDDKKRKGVVPSIDTIRSTSQISPESGYKPTTDVVIMNPHKIGGKSKVPIDKIDPDDYDLVIVDEAHHYPAPTWKRIVDRFPKCKRLFLTATPYRNGKLLDITPCFTLEYEDAVRKGIIRGLDKLDEVLPHEQKNEEEIYKV